MKDTHSRKLPEVSVVGACLGLLQNRRRDTLTTSTATWAPSNGTLSRLDHNERHDLLVSPKPRPLYQNSTSLRGSSFNALFLITITPLKGPELRLAFAGIAQNGS